MPIVTEESQPKRRRAPWWVLGFALVAWLPAGLCAWVLFAPVNVSLGGQILRIAVVPNRISRPVGSFYVNWQFWAIVAPLPHHLGNYWIGMDSP